MFQYKIGHTKTSVLFTKFHFSRIRKKVPALGGYDLKWTGTIFILGRDNIRTKVWGKFHKNWTKIRMLK